MVIDDVKISAMSREDYKACYAVKDEMKSMNYVRAAFLITLVFVGFYFTLEDNYKNDHTMKISLWISYFLSMIVSLLYFKVFHPLIMLREKNINKKSLNDVLNFKSYVLSDIEKSELMKEYGNIFTSEIKSFIEIQPCETLRDFIELNEKLKALKLIDMVYDRFKAGVATAGVAQVFKTQMLTMLNRQDLNILSKTQRYGSVANEFIKDDRKKVRVDEFVKKCYHQV